MISIVTGCYNEEENVELLAEAIRKKMGEHPSYKYEHIFIDNCSTDNTRELLTKLAQSDRNIKVIFNTRNFGHIRSPVYGILQAKGDAVILMASDFQDPIFLITSFIEGWEEGFKCVLAVKSGSKEKFILYHIRLMFYSFMSKIAGIKLIKNYTGTGLYDREVVEHIRKINDPYPYFRGLIPEIGFKHKVVLFEQPLRERGITKNNFFTLYDMAMTGVIGYSRFPMRITTMLGFIAAIGFFIIGLVYLVLKLLFWDQMSLGIAPLIIVVGWFASIQLLVLGVIGEYIGSILTQVQHRPLVVEEKRLNFDDP